MNFREAHELNERRQLTEIVAGNDRGASVQPARGAAKKVKAGAWNARRAGLDLHLGRLTEVIAAVSPALAGTLGGENPCAS